MLKKASAPLGGAKCSDIFTYLKKDRFTPDQTASPDSKPQLDPTEGVSCDLCAKDISLLKKDNELVRVFKRSHYIKECTAVPGPFFHFFLFLSTHFFSTFFSFFSS